VHSVVWVSGSRGRSDVSIIRTGAGALIPNYGTKLVGKANFRKPKNLDDDGTLEIACYTLTMTHQHQLTSSSERGPEPELVTHCTRLRCPTTIAPMNLRLPYHWIGTCPSKIQIALIHGLSSFHLTAAVVIKARSGIKLGTRSGLKAFNEDFLSSKD
jgi:hypothetical protein